MRGTDHLLCWIKDCGNEATEFGEFTFALNEKNKLYPNLCVCHVKGHTLKVVEQTNAYSLIQCQMSMCGYEERVEVAVGCEEVGPKDVFRFELQEKVCTQGDCLRCGANKEDVKKEYQSCSVYGTYYNRHSYNTNCNCTLTQPHDHLTLGKKCECE